mmetsp:Transcript_15708/g.40550  ORF Transcript_15708/g.40550 Transcript_15708/m.40550 type:complete len:241 (-) Transcript_15708:7-729(-)
MPAMGCSASPKSATSTSCELRAANESCREALVASLRCGPSATPSALPTLRMELARSVWNGSDGSTPTEPGSSRAARAGSFGLTACSLRCTCSSANCQDAPAALKASTPTSLCRSRTAALAARMQHLRLSSACASGPCTCPYAVCNARRMGSIPGSRSRTLAKSSSEACWFAKCLCIRTAKVEPPPAAVVELLRFAMLSMALRGGGSRGGCPTEARREATQRCISADDAALKRYERDGSLA